MMDSLGPFATSKPVVARDWLSVATSIKTPMSGAALLEMVSQVTGVSLADLKSPRRHVKTCRARHIFCAVARQCTTLSFPKIAALVGGRDHSTIMHGIVKVEQNPGFFEPELTICRKLGFQMVLERESKRLMHKTDKDAILGETKSI